MADLAKALLGVVEGEIEALQTVAIFCGSALLASLLLLLKGWI